MGTLIFSKLILTRYDLLIGFKFKYRDFCYIKGSTKYINAIYIYNFSFYDQCSIGFVTIFLKLLDISIHYIFKISTSSVYTCLFLFCHVYKLN